MEKVKNVQVKGSNEGMVLEGNFEFDKLLVALDYLKGHEVVADTLNGFMTFQDYENFDYSLFLNAKGNMVLDLKDEDDRAESIGFKIDEVEDVYIDDNSQYLDGTTEEQYEVDNIIFTLWNGDKLRLELQW